MLFATTSRASRLAICLYMGSNTLKVGVTVLEYMKKNSINILVLILILVAISFRVFSYGDLRLSVGYADTPGYIESAAEPFFSWKLFAGKRLFTTNLIYESSEKSRSLTTNKRNENMI